MLLVLVAVIATVRTDHHRLALLVGICCGLIANEYSVLLQKYLHGRHQCPGLFDHQNAMAMYVVLVLPTIFGVLLSSTTPRWLTLIFALTCLCGMHSLLASLSRASLLVGAAALTGTLAASWLSGWSKRRAIVCAAFGMAAILAVVVSLPTLVERFAGSRANDASHRTREVMNETAAAMHRDHPWFGVGPNNFAEAVNWSQYAGYIDVSQREKGHKVDAHYKRGIVESHYWQMRSETGWIGFISFLAIIIISLSQSLVKAFSNRHPLQRMIAFGIGFGLLGNYLQSMIEHTLVNNNNLALWMLLTGIVITLPYRKHHDHEKVGQPLERGHKRQHEPNSVSQARSANTTDLACQLQRTGEETAQKKRQVRIYYNEAPECTRKNAKYRANDFWPNVVGELPPCSATLSSKEERDVADSTQFWPANATTLQSAASAGSAALPSAALRSAASESSPDFFA